jgi:hypothetical protein
MQGAWLCEACGAVNRAAVATCCRCESPQPEPAKSVTQGSRGPLWAPSIQAQPTYIPAWPIGYVSAALLVAQIVLQLGLMAAVSLLLLPAIAAERYEVTDGWLAFFRVCAIWYFVALVGSAVVHGAFLALTDLNTPALGGGKPRFGPLRAFFWWVESALWAWRANLTVWIPLGIGVLVAAYVNSLLAAIVTPVSLMIATMAFGFPVSVLRKAGRLPEDLTMRLAPTAISHANRWSSSWVTARMCDLLAPFVMVALIVTTAILLTQAPYSAGGGISSAQIRVVSSAGIAVVVVAIVLSALELAANALALVMLTRMTLSLSRAQMTGRKGVRDSGLVFDGEIGLVQPPPTPIAPAPAAPKPRWIRSPAEIAGESQLAEDPSEEPRPIAPRPVESSRVVLLPSSRTLSRYGSRDRDAPGGKRE